MVDRSFFEIKKVAEKRFELFLNKEIDGNMNALLVDRTSEEDIFPLEGLIEMCRLNSGELGHLQANAKPIILFPPKKFIN